MNVESRDSESRFEQIAAYTGPRPDLFDAVPLRAKSVLDVGCSNGELGSALRSIDAQRRVVGIELDPSLAQQASGRLDDVVCGDVSALDWNDALGVQQFDCIIFGDVLEHLVAPESVLQVASKFLAPQGVFVVSFPNIRHLSALWSIAVRGSFPRRPRGIFDATHLRWFTRHDMVLLLESLGFRVVSTRCSLRFGDKGGGRLNRILNRLSGMLSTLPPVREFLAYQYCMTVARMK